MTTADEPSRKSRLRGFLRLSLLLALAAGLGPGPHPLSAQSPDSSRDVSAVVAIEGLLPREEAPFRLRVTIVNASSDLIRGRLRVEIRAGRSSVEVLSDPVSLKPGDQRLDLRAPMVPGDFEDVSAHLRFVPEQGNPIDLGRQSLVSATRVSRSFSIAVCTTLQWDSLHTQFAGALAAERYVEPPPNPGWTKQPRSSVVQLRPEELGRQPLSLCSYDVLVLAGDGFAYLDDGQLAAVARWVRAGGSLCVIPGSVMPQGHYRTVREWCGAGGEPPLLLSPKGEVRRGPGLPFSGFGTFPVGLGQLAVVLPDADALLDLGGVAMREAHSKIWRFTPATRRKLALDASFASAGLETTPLAGPGLFVRATASEAVRTIPRPLLLFLLLLFLIAVGPADYVLLGKWRRRKLTWLVFPAVSLVFAGIILFITELYLGGSETPGSVVVVDLADDGAIVRENRFSVTLSQRPQRLRTKHVAATSVPIQNRREWPETVFSGRYPSEYEVDTQTGKWVTQVRRSLRFEPSPEATRVWSDASREAVDWDRLRGYEANAIHRLTDGRSETISTLLALEPDFEGAVYLASEAQFRRVLGPRGTMPRPLIQKLTFLPGRGLGQHLTRVSPHGGPSMVDMPLLGRESNPDEWVLIRVARDGDDIYLYRWHRRTDIE